MTEMASENLAVQRYDLALDLMKGRDPAGAARYVLDQLPSSTPGNFPKTPPLNPKTFGPIGVSTNNGDIRCRNVHYLRRPILAATRAMSAATAVRTPRSASSVLWMPAAGST